MKLKSVVYAIVLACMFIVADSNAQVTSVKYQIRFNPTNCRYDCYLIIVSGTATTASQRLQFNAQYSIVVPTGSSIAVAQNFMPLNNNQTYTGTVPLKWQLSSSVIAPAAEPQSDFHSITPTLSPSSFYNNLAPGDSIRLFSLTISPTTSCASGIRIFRNGIDPGSGAPGMDGGDFSNGFTMGSPSQLYSGNAPQVYPTGPTLSASTACSLGVEINLTASTTACQSPLTYQWSGPDGYTSTTQNVRINPATTANAGTYKVTVTSAPGCTSTLSINASSKPNAGPDLTGCAGASVTLTGTAPTTGTWSAQGSNPVGSTLGSTTNGVASASYTASATGIYKYIYTSGSCSDTTNVNVTLPDAGPNPQPVGCYISGTATMAAVGSGTWTLSNLSSGTATILNPTNPNTTVSGFSVAGTYILEWTVNGCKATAQIVVGDNCTCTILNNSVVPVSPANYCGNSGLIALDGAAVTPPGGVYTWQYSLNGGTYANATGTNNLEDYTTPSLGQGTHRYRRLYSIPSDPLCKDTSNVVLFTVNNIPAVPANLTANPNPVCLGNPVALSVTNNPGATYIWSASSPSAGLVVVNSNTTTMNASAAGAYLINVTQTVSGCASPQATVNVVVNAVPPTPTAGTVSFVNPTTCGGNNGSITFSSLPANTSFTVNYTKNGFALFANITSNNSGVAVMTAQSAGAYSNFTITNASGCTSGNYAGPVTLTDPDAPAAPAGLAADPNPTCTGNVVNLSVTNNPGAVYTWSASSPNAGLVSSATNTTTLVPIVSGFYNINVTQTLAGCTSIPASIGILINNAPPTPTSNSVTSVNPSTCGASNGSISLSGFLNLTSYSFTYSKNNVPVTLNITTNNSGVAIISNLTSGTYTNFSITSGSGCTSGIYAGPVNLIDPSTPAAPAGLAAVPNPVCLSKTVNLSVTNTAGATYTWSASSASAGLVSTTTNATTMVPTSVGNYTISVTQTIAGCTSPASTVVVAVNPTPPTPTAGNVTSQNPSACGGTNGSISIAGLLNSTAYTIQYLRNGQAASANVTTNASGVAIISGLNAGNYTAFVVVNASNCSSGTYAGPVVLTDPNAPSAPAGLTALPNPVCPNTTVNLSVTNNPGATYVWSASSANAGLNAGSVNTATMLSSVTGNYIISVTQTVAGCTSPASTVTVTVNSAPPTPVAGNITSANPSSCGGTNGSISIAGLTVSTAYTINYTKNGNPLSANITSNGSGVVVIPNLTSGNYSGFRITDSNGCSSGTYNGTVSLSDPGSPAAPANLTANPNPVCIGTTVNLSVTNNPGAVYTWSASSGNAGLVTSTTNATTMLATLTGQYTINVIQTVAGCTSPSASVVVNVNAIPPTMTGANITGNNPTTCGGNQGTIVFVGLPASAAYTVNYSKNNVPTTASITTNASGGATITGLTAGTYTNFSLTGTGSCTSGIYAGPVNLTDPPTPGAPAGLNATPNPVCLGNAVSLSVINNAGAIYTWTASSPDAGLAASSTNTAQMTALLPGSYTISVTQTVAGCLSPASTIVVNINPLPVTPTANTLSKTNPTTCSGNDGTISITGYLSNANYTVNYNKNGSPVVVSVTSNSTGVIILNALSAGTYADFRVTNSQGCNSGIYTGSIVLTDPPVPSAPLNLTAVPNPACLGTTIALNVTNENGATYAWSASSQGAGLAAGNTNQASLLPTIAAAYTVSVTKTVAGCLSPAATINVTVNPIPPTLDQSSFSTINPTCGGSNGVISINGLPANTMYTVNFKFNNNATSQSVQSNSSGTAILLGLTAGNFTDFNLINTTGCASGIYAGPVVLSDPGLPSAPAGLMSNPASICIRSTVTLSVINNPGAIYSWRASDLGSGLQFSNTNTTMMMPTSPGFYTISVTQTVNGCVSPAATIVLEVKGDCYNPDFDVTYINIALTGDLSTNDVVLPDKTYGAAMPMPDNPSSCIPVVGQNGKYTFSCTVPGKYSYFVPVCNGLSSMMCANIPLVITVLQPMISNNPPIANHDYVRTKTGIPIMINLKANDKCQSAPNCTLGAPVVVVNPLHGSFNAGTLIYTPQAGFMGTDSLKYRVCQTPVITPVNCEEAWAYITVVGSSSPNITNGMDDYGQTPLNTPLVVNAAQGLKSNDTDPEGDLQVITPMDVTVSGKGSFNVLQDGSYTFTPMNGFVGPVDCPYEVCDNVSPKACDIATIHILVEPSVPRGSIGNKVWHDLNGDGQQSINEPGIAGVTVKLYSASGILLSTKVTNASGEYLFDMLQSGSYYVQFVKSTQYEFTFAKIGGGNSDSDVTHEYGFGTTGLINILPGQNNLDVDAGVYICSKIGDRVWYDINKNDVWDTNENGINGLKVSLWRNHFGTWVVWTNTYTVVKPGSPSDDGFFQFCAPPGQYYVQIILPPLGLVQVQPNRGNNPLIDSDLTNANGVGTTNTFSVLSGVNKLDIGGGFYPMAVAGNLVWMDVNQNGIQDVNEPKVSGIAVKAFDANTHTMIAEAITNSDGLYMLDYLEQKDVYLKFSVPAQYSATKAKATDDDKDSDVDHTFGPNTTNRISMRSGITNNNIDLGIMYGVLPVDWLYIKAKKKDKVHAINWATQKEVNVDYYELERKIGKNGDFLNTGITVKAQKASEGIHEYEAFDLDTETPGVYYYRVKQVDFDGKYAYSDIAYISTSSQSDIRIYPSPSVNEANLDITIDVLSKVNIELFDASSKLVKTIHDKVLDEGLHTFKMDLSQLPASVYNLVITLNGERISKKVIKID